MDLSYLIANHCFSQEAPLSESSFNTHCKDRGVDLGIGTEMLEALHEHGLLVPLFGIRHPVVTRKLIIGPDGSELRQSLEPSEQWDGPVCQEYGGISSDDTMLQAYLQHGFIVDARSTGFQPWNSYREVKLQGRAISWVYSPFQVIAASEATERLHLRLRPNQLVEAAAGAPLPESGVKIAAGFNLKQCRSFVADFDALLNLLLLVQGRYLPSTRRNRTMISVRIGRVDWDQWCNAFDPGRALTLSGLDTSEVKNWAEWLQGHARHIDPLGAWSPFRELVTHEAKARLRGDALLCETYYAASEVLAGLLEDVGGGKVERTRNEPLLASLYGPGWRDRHHEACGYICAQLGIHPEPVAVVYVEDLGVARHVIPGLIEAIGPAPAQGLGIQVVSIGGTGQLNKSSLIGRLEYLLGRGIPVWFVFDNENRAPQNWQALESTFPKRFPSLANAFEHLVQRQIWPSNFEFANFSDRELAVALVELCGGSDDDSRVGKVAPRIARARSTFGQRDHTTLETVFEEAFGGGTLDKVQLARILLERALAQPGIESKGDERRPIVKVVRDIVQAAVLHSKPTFAHRANG